MSSAATGFGPKVAGEGQALELSMQRLQVTGEVLPVGARLKVQHVFRSSEKRPVEVIYAFPLPRDASMRGFHIKGGGFDVHSELRENEAAVQAFEAAIASGSLGALARQYGDGLVNLTVGNLRPSETVTVEIEMVTGVELRDDGFRFRFPFTLAPAYHPRARMAGGEMELPADEFGDVILPPIREDANGLHEVGFDLAVVVESVLEEIGSPSHPLRVRRQSDRRCRVSLGQGADVPDRDLVLDARYEAVSPQVLSSAGHFAAVVPSRAFGANPNTARSVVILLDRSGSMFGPPMEQALKSINACLATLSEQDQFGLIAFDDQIEVFDNSKVAPASRERREKARQFLTGIDARGGTELAKGFEEAAKMLKAGGDVFVLTDGQVSGTEAILARAREAKVRLHCLGIGSASEDRFLALLARETGGVSRFVTPRERVDLSAVDLFASIGRPVATELQVEGDVQPGPAAFVLEGTPVVLFGKGSEPVVLRWNGGSLTLAVGEESPGLGDTIRLLQGARLITDWDSRYPAAEALSSLEKRKQSRVASELRRLSVEYGLTSREMTLVAVVRRSGDKPGELPDTRVVPLGMPRDTAFGAYFASRTELCGMLDAPSSTAFETMFLSGGRKYAAAPSSMHLEELLACAPTSFTARTERVRPAEDRLMELAGQMEPDGGMPGGDAEQRAGASLAALLAFVSQGGEKTKRAFRSHVKRLVGFLEKLALAPERRRVVDAVLAAVREGRELPGDWVAVAERQGDRWAELAYLASARQ